MIQGPITGGKHGWAFGRPLFDLATHGYLEEEFFFAGDASDAGFGVLKLTPWRIDVWSLEALMRREKPRTWKAS